MHQGETPSNDPGYTFGESASSMDSRWILVAKELKEADLGFVEDV